MLTRPIADGVELRPLEPHDAPVFAAMLREHADVLLAALPWWSAYVDDAAARAWLQRWAERAAADTGRIYALWEDGSMIGGTCFPVFAPDRQTCEVGVWLIPSVTGRGLITGACTAMIDWAVDERGMHRVEWVCAAHNTASRAVAQRLGMTHEGTKRAAYLAPDGTRWDMEQWAILAPDWLARR